MLWLTCLFLGAVLPSWAGSTDDRWIEVSTDSLHLVFDRQGGVPVTWEIIDPRYVDQARGERVALIDGARARAPGAVRPLDLISADASRDRWLRESLYMAARHDTPDAVELVFELLSTESAPGLRRLYRLPKRGFAVELTLAWITPDQRTRSPASIQLALGPGLGFDPVARGGLSDGMYAYVSPVWATSGEVVTPKLSADQTSVEGPANLRWAGLHSRYFLFGIAPRPGTVLNTVSAALPAAAPGVVEATRMARPQLTLTLTADARTDAGSTSSVTVFGGPKARDELAATDAGFDRVLFSRVWKWIRWLCFVLLRVLLWIHGLVPSWGISLILLAAVIRVVTFPVAQFGMREQAKFNAVHARLRPELEQIKLACQGDPQRRHEETTALYRKHGVSPFAAFKGCGWVMLQIPIFIALFNLIGQEYALRGAGFLWIEDLSQPDRLFSWGVALPFLGSYFNVLPLLMGATQVLVSRIAPAAGDPQQLRQQHRNMLLMAAAFTLLFYTFPAGLIIYWTAANLGHLAQQALGARWRRV